MWNQIISLPLSRPTGTTIKPFSALPQLTPSDKTSTSLRLLLQDAQKSMEKFSQRLDNLFGSLETTRQGIDNVQSLFEESRERTAEETRATGEFFNSIYAGELDFIPVQ